MWDNSTAGRLQCVLESISMNVPEPSYGLCTNVTESAKVMGFDPHTLREYQDHLVQMWPKFTGEVCYPIPGGTEVSCRISAYFSGQREGTLWDETHPYGALRWELLHWLIEQCKAAQGEEHVQH